MARVPNRPLFFISAGEPSGDIHAAELVGRLKERFPNARFTAYGGQKLREAGCDTPVLLTELALMWFGRVLMRLPTFIGYLRRAEKFFAEERPDLVIVVDFPGFNWHIARLAKKHGIPVCYFLPPQMWGWGGWRIKKTRKYIDFCLCSLPFEKRWFSDRGVRAEYFGHPFLAEARSKGLDEGFLVGLRRQYADRSLLLLLPGSRDQEVAVNFGDMVKIAQKVTDCLPNVVPVIGAFNEKHAEMVRRRLGRDNLLWPVFVGRAAELMELSRAALAVSGSVSMELLAHKRPTVIYYRVSRLAMFLQRFFRRVKFITLVNIIAADIDAGDETSGTPAESPFYGSRQKVIPAEPTDHQRAMMLFPEFLTCRARTQQAAAPLIEYLRWPEERKRQEERLAALLAKVDDGSDPLERAAEVIERFLAREQPSR
ncbi:MAG: hypothetical protein IIZ25_02430 [Thermoguttaceae bacterium]|nr:hypothetical protein [Thermoguttaceae bacterium]